MSNPAYRCLFERHRPRQPRRSRSPGPRRCAQSLRIPNSPDVSMTIFSVFRAIAATLVKQINMLHDFSIVLQVATRRQYCRHFGNQHGCSGTLLAARTAALRRFVLIRIQASPPPFLFLSHVTSVQKTNDHSVVPSMAAGLPRRLAALDPAFFASWRLASNTCAGRSFRACRAASFPVRWVRVFFRSRPWPRPGTRLHLSCAPGTKLQCWVASALWIRSFSASSVPVRTAACCSVATWLCRSWSRFRRKARSVSRRRELTAGTMAHTVSMASSAGESSTSDNRGRRGRCTGARKAYFRARRLEWASGHDPSGRRAYENTEGKTADEIARETARAVTWP